MQGMEQQIASDLEDLVYEYPDVAVKMLKEWGVTASDMRDEIYKQTGDLA